MAKPREGCVLVRRGLLDHFPSLGAAGVTMYLYLLLAMDPGSRMVVSTLSELADGLGWSVPRVSDVLRRLEASGYVAVTRRPSYGVAVHVERPGCPDRAGKACLIAQRASACLAVAETLALAAAASEADTYASARAIEEVLLVWAKHRLPGWVAAGRTQADRQAVAEAIRTFGRTSVIAAVERYASELAAGRMPRRLPRRFFEPLKLAQIVSALRKEEEDGRA